MQVEREEERVDVIRRDVVHSSFIIGIYIFVVFDSSIEQTYRHDTRISDCVKKKCIIERRTDLYLDILYILSI